MKPTSVRVVVFATAAIGLGVGAWIDTMTAAEFARAHAQIRTSASSFVARIEGGRNPGRGVTITAVQVGGLDCAVMTPDRSDEPQQMFCVGGRFSNP